jgi:hypothetical protein
MGTPPSAYHTMKGWVGDGSKAIPPEFQLFFEEFVTVGAARACGSTSIQDTVE